MGESGLSSGEIGHANIGCLPMLGVMITVALSIVVGLVMLLV